MRISLLLILLTFSLNAQGKWHVTTQKVTGAKGSGEDDKIVFTAHNPVENKEYSITKSIVKGNYLPAADVFNSGNMLIVSPSEGNLEIFSEDGVVKNISFLRNIKPDSKVVVKFHLCDSTAAVLASADNNKFAVFLLVDKSGEIINQKKISDKSANGVVNSCRFIAVGTSNWEEDGFTERCTFLNSEGEELGNVNLSFTNGQFSAENESFFGYTTSNIFLSSPENIKIHWNRELEPDRSIVDAQWFGKNIYVITSALPVLIDNRWLYNDLILKEIDVEGKTLKEEILPAGKYEFPRISVKEGKMKILLDSSEYIIEQ